MATPQEILKQYWGFTAFRELQLDIIQSVMEGRDTLALLPTGGGKSICFQVPGLLLPGITIVVSPLIALMKDQVEQLEKRGIKAVAIYSGMPPREIDILLDNCVYGKVKFLYISPERLKTDLFLARAAKMNVSLLAIDEAHCISQWGYDFRPPYLEIAEFRDTIPKVKVIALTATATPPVSDDILLRLKMQNAAIFRKSFARKNLSYSIRPTENKEQKMLEIMRKVPGSAVVYVRNRGKTQQVAEFLNKNRVSADYYHAGLPNAVRARKQEDWIKNKTRVVVATNAFGMGIDKPDVRLVVHLDLPDSLEAYYQEAGRAGRDEKIAYAVLLFHALDADDLLRKTNLSHPTIDYIKRVYQSLANHLKIAVGSSMMVNYDFDLEEFSKNYSLHPFEVFNAIKKLEESGLLQLTESFYKPSKVLITIDHKELYKFQVANEKLDPLIKGMLRLYGGEIFTAFTTISEKSLTKMTPFALQEIKTMLRFLDKTNVLVYDEQKDMPQVTFLTPRQDASQLDMDVKKLEARKEVTLGKVNKMIAYAQNANQCRTKIFQDYFGEMAFKNCGNCDVCIARKKSLKEHASKVQMINETLLLIPEDGITWPELRMKSPIKDDFMLSEILRELSDNKKITLLPDGKLVVLKK